MAYGGEWANLAEAATDSKGFVCRADAGFTGLVVDRLPTITILWVFHGDLFQWLLAAYRAAVLYFGWKVSNRWLLMLCGALVLLPAGLAFVRPVNRRRKVGFARFVGGGFGSRILLRISRVAPLGKQT